MSKTARDLAAYGLLLLNLTGGAWAAPEPSLQAEIAIELAPGQGQLTGTMRLDLATADPLTLALGPGYRFTEVTLKGEGETERLGKRGVTLSPAASGEAVLRWSGSPQGDQRQGGLRQAYLRPEGAWLPADSGWYPRPGAQRMGYTLTVTLPERLQATASGSRSDDHTEAGQRQITFSHPEPGDAITLLAAEWQKRTREAEHGTVLTLFPEALAGQHETYLERTARYLDEYGDWIGPPPHDTYTVAAAPFPVGLAFPGFTLIGEQVLPLPFIPDTSLAHEVIHNWWGRGVYTEAGSGNWSEALTYYMGDYHQAAHRDPEEARRMRGDWLHSEAALPEAASYPLEAFQRNTDAYDEVIGYQRGAFLLHTLYRELGEEGFNRAIRRFYREHRHREADWPDLKAAFTEAAEAQGQDGGRAGALIDWFLNANEPPQLAFDETTLEVTEQDDGSFRVAADLNWDAAGYPVRIPVVLTSAEGTAERLEVRIPPGEQTRVTLESDAAPRHLQADPDHHVYRELAPGEGIAILRNALLAERVTLVSEWDGLLEIARGTFTGEVARGEADRERPLLIIGTRQQVARTLEAVRACTTERIRPIDASPLAWASTTGGGQPLIALTAESPEQARQALRRLGRYGRYSYVAPGEGHQAETGHYEPTDRHALRLPLDEHLATD
ncbi:MAG: M1 family metallopeptidase [Halorhodospira sp.]